MQLNVTVRGNTSDKRLYRRSGKKIQTDKKSDAGKKRDRGILCWGKKI